MVEQVECRSDSQYAERPVAFFWQGEHLEVNKIQARWRSPEGMTFRVIAGDDQIFELYYDEGNDFWKVVQK